MKTSIPRLRSVKLKSGATLHVFRNTTVQDCKAAFAVDCRDITKQRDTDLVGFAIVAWGLDGGVSTTLRIRDSRQVGRTMAPDFVRSALIDHNATD
jgi:hypothetical protein